MTKGDEQALAEASQDRYCHCRSVWDAAAPTTDLQPQLMHLQSQASQLRADLKVTRIARTDPDPTRASSR